LHETLKLLPQLATVLTPLAAPRLQAFERLYELRHRLDE
jgi:hypothetical protein